MICVLTKKREPQKTCKGEIASYRDIKRECHEDGSRGQLCSLKPRATGISTVGEAKKKKHRTDSFLEA